MKQNCIFLSDDSSLPWLEQDSCGEQDDELTNNHTHDPKSPPPSDIGIGNFSHYRKSRKILPSIRIILLDLPLCLLFGMLLLFVSLEHIHNEYLEPLGNRVHMDDRRLKGGYSTYYDRSCDKKDMTTDNAWDLVLPPNVDLDDAVDNVLLHGASVVPGVLKESTAEAMKEYILSKNANLNRKETYKFVHGFKNRWLFYHGSEEDPSIVKALREIAFHPTLRPLLDRLVGPNPAVVEFSTITAGFGAEAQPWHSDLLEGFHQNHARTFLPQYSIFIPLQNTTADMGATAVSPGSHMCNSFTDSFQDYGPYGFQVMTVPADGENLPHWKAGDCVVMNQRTLHRGEAHTVMNGPPRAMLIMSITSKPSAVGFQSRIPSLGSTNQMRSDMYGHTLDDFGHADVAMVQPWATLRSLGLMTLPGREWGWDYVTSAVMRIINNDAGFSSSEGVQSDLGECLRNGCGLYFPPIDSVPHFLRGDASFGWWYFLVDSLDLCMFFTTFIYLGSLCIYLLLVIYLPSMMKSDSSQRKPTKGRIDCTVSAEHISSGSARKALHRLVCLHGAIFLVFLICLHHMNTTKWAKGIKSGRLYKPRSLDSLMEKMIKRIDHKKIPSYTVTSLTEGDVLIRTPMNSEPEVASNQYLSYHPGNRRWRELISNFVAHDIPAGSLSPLIYKAVSRGIVKKITKKDGLFLSQNKFGTWLVMSEHEAVEATEKEIQKSLDRLFRVLDGVLSTMLGGSLYGDSHLSLISRTFTPQMVKKWREALFYFKNGKYPGYDLKQRSRYIRIRPKRLNDENYNRSLRLHLFPLVKVGKKMRKKTIRKSLI